jgi:multisubunit Na+/H+ antiporter MnhE subunit
VARVPTFIQDLLKLGFGFIIAVGAIAIFANWNSPNRFAVIVTVLIGLVVFLLLEALAAGLAVLVFGRRKKVE